eukprot:1425720-Karenia_brevis.AAC.1
MSLAIQHSSRVQAAWPGVDHYRAGLELSILGPVRLALGNDPPSQRHQHPTTPWSASHPGHRG